MTSHTPRTQRLIRTLWMLTALCLTTSLGLVACSTVNATRPDGSCVRNALALTQGLYLELATTLNASDGRLPRRTVQNWPWANHPHHSAPDMLMKLDKTNNRVVLTYKRDGEQFAEHWTIDSAQKRTRTVLTSP